MGQPRVEETPSGQVFRDLSIMPVAIIDSITVYVQVIVFPVRLNVNQKSMSIEGLIERRKVLLCRWFQSRTFFEVGSESLNLFDDQYTI